MPDYSNADAQQIDLTRIETIVAVTSTGTETI